MTVDGHQCWKELPGPCLQAIGRHLTAHDAAAVRLTCNSWSHSVGLPRINFKLTDRSSCSRNCCPTEQLQLQQQQELLASLRQPSSCSKYAREFIITVQAGSAALLGSAHEHDGDVAIDHQEPSIIAQLAAVLPQLPCLDSLTIRTRRNRGSWAWSSATAGVLPVVLQPLLQSQLQHSLHSLTLSLHIWPAGHQLAPLLQLQQPLRSLTLTRCPLSIICSLPSLPHLQQLTITGLINEPVPASYSYKRAPMLPLLPQLQRLVLQGLPVDLRVQELEDIEAGLRAARKARQWQQQQQQQQQHVLASWQQGQWIGSSIASQCPGLMELQSDAELGPALLSLANLTALHGVHPGWLEAGAAAAAAATTADTEQTSNMCHAQCCVPGSMHRLPQLQQLRHLGIGVDTARDCQLLAQLTGLQSLVLWPSSSAKQRQQQAVAAAAAGDTADGSMALPCIKLVLSAGMGQSLERIVIAAGWRWGSGDEEVVQQQCRQLKELQVMRYP